MADYPAPVFHTDFPDYDGFHLPDALLGSPTLPALVRPTVSSGLNTLVPTTKSQAGVAAIWIRNHGSTRVSTSFGTFDQHFEPANTAQACPITYWFAPLAETSYFDVDLLQADRLYGLKVELFAAGEVTPLETWFFGKTNRTLVNGRNAPITSWDGRVRAILAGGVVTAARSPYKLKVTAMGLHGGEPVRYPIAWTYFAVLAHTIELAWGKRTRPEHAAVLDRLKKDAPHPGAIAEHAVVLGSNFFAQSVDDMHCTTGREDPRFSAHAEAWGEGPYIPMIARVPVRLSTSGQGGQDCVFVPQALGDLWLLWQREPLPELAIQNGRAKAFVDAYLDRTVSGRDSRDPPGSRNCHGQDGGKRDRVDVFVAWKGTDAFPFMAGIPPRAPWTAVSRVQPEEPSLGMSGVLFRPSTIAGDGYAMRAVLALVARPDGRLQPWRLHDAEFDTRPAGLPASARVQFRVLRSLDVAAYQKSHAGVANLDFAAVARLFEPAGIVIDVVHPVAPPDDHQEIRRAIRSEDGYDEDFAFDGTPNKQFHFFDVAVHPPQMDDTTLLRCRSLEQCVERVCAYTLGRSNYSQMIDDTSLWSSTKKSEIDDRKQRLAALVAKQRGEPPPSSQSAAQRARPPLNQILLALLKGRDDVQSALARVLGVPSVDCEWNALEKAYLARCKRAAREVAEHLCKQQIEACDDQSREGLVVLHAGELAAVDGSDALAGFQMDAGGMDVELFSTTSARRLGAICVSDAGGHLILTTAHEIGHASGLCHAPYYRSNLPPFAQTSDLQTFAKFHDLNDKTCLMSYLPSADHFCGMCILRLRGFAPDRIVNTWDGDLDDFLVDS